MSVKLVNCADARVGHVILQRASFSNACTHQSSSENTKHTQVCFSPDGRWVLSASFDKSIKLWDGAKGTFAATFRGHVGPVYQVRWLLLDTVQFDVCLCVLGVGLASNGAKGTFAATFRGHVVYHVRCFSVCHTVVLIWVGGLRGDDLASSSAATFRGHVGPVYQLRDLITAVIFLDIQLCFNLLLSNAMQCS